MIAVINLLNQENDIGGSVSCGGEMRNAYKISVRKPEVNRPLEKLALDGRILKWILNNTV